MCVCVCVCACVCVRVSVCVCVSACVHLCLRECTCLCMFRVGVSVIIGVSACPCVRAFMFCLVNQIDAGGVANHLVKCKALDVRLLQLLAHRKISKVIV